MTAAPAQSPRPASAEAATAKMVELLLRVPAADRVRFARSHLLPQCASLVQAFDRIEPGRRERSVLYLVPHPHSREVRLARACRLAGWDPILVSGVKPGYATSGLFTQSHHIENPLLLVLASWLFPGPLVHMFVLRGDHAYLAAATKTRRVILDCYDTGSGMKDAGSDAAGVERAALAAVDGVTHRDLRLRYLQRLHGYSLPTAQMFIHDPFPEGENQWAPQSSNVIRVVSTGWIAEGDSSILRTARALCAAEIHVHAYFNPMQKPDHPQVREYRSLAQETAFFHIEGQVYGDAYWQHLSRYDFGLSINERLMFSETPQSYTMDYLQGCGSSRLSDYIVAGLGVIVSPELHFQHFWARRFASALVSASRELLRNPRPILESAMRAAAPKSLDGARASDAASRLGAFYDRVARGPELNAGPTRLARSGSFESAGRR